MNDARSQTPAPAGASEPAILQHYDAGNAFYAAWLDRSMTYSAGRWTGERGSADTLEEAQARKLDWHLEAAGVAPGARILDVGCGWGSLLFRALQQRRVARAVGLSPSPSQCDWIGTHGSEDNVEAICSVWQKARPERDFDAIFSIGAIEHFARPGLKRDEKIQAYEAFFEFCRQHIRDDGRLSIQFIGWMDIESEAETSALPSALFPESNLPRIAEIMAAAEQSFHPLILENRPEDYARTLQAWLSRLNEARDQLIADHGAELVKRYIRGFRKFLLGFEIGTVGLYRMALRPRNPGARRVLRAY